MGNLWRSCAKVCDPIKLSFGVVSWVSSSIGVLDGGLRSSRVREVLGGFVVSLLVWELPLHHRQRNVFGSFAKIC